ncbi:MAG: hypothetical protein IJM30_05090 [Thermoguttaceae bacterium]|nr:hypothetical protein [Thermoguttaceae bacterium]
MKSRAPSLRFFASIFAILVALIVGCDQFVPSDYETTVATGGEIEETYLSRGQYEVDYLEFDAPEPMKKYVVYFPSVLKDSAKKFPVVVFVNGTGVLASKYPALFNHLASWGFVVIGNEDPGTWSGKSADQTLGFILDENEREESVFFDKINRDAIGISGHSQGGVGVFNAITINERSSLYKTAVALSPTNETGAAKLRIPYDSSKVAIPILIVAGDGDAFETKFVIPLEELKKTYARIAAPKAAMRKKGRGHGQTLYSADGYVTAWFMARLQNDERAAKAFEGGSPEALDNSLYRDQWLDLEVRQ